MTRAEKNAIAAMLTTCPTHPLPPRRARPRYSSTLDRDHDGIAYE